MEIVSVRLIRERDQSRNFVLLHCFDGVGPLLATIARTDVDEFARQPLLPSDQNFLVEKNLGTLASIIAAKYKRGEVTERTIPRGRKVHALIELTQDDLEQGLKRHQVVADAPIGTEFGKTAVPSVPPPTQPPPASLGDGGSEAANRIIAAWAPRWHSSLQPPQRTSALVPGAALGDPNDRTGEAPGGATSITQTALLAAWQERPPEPQSVLNPGVRGQEKNWGFAETGDRAELIRRLDAIEGTLQRLAPLVEAVAWSRSERAQIGHNHPPEHIDVPPLSSVDVEMGTAAVNLVRIELNSEQPRSDILKVCGLVLRSISARVQAFVAWTAVKGDVFLDAALKEFGKRAVQGVISIVVLQEILQNLHLDLAAAINTIFHAFK